MTADGMNALYKKLQDSMNSTADGAYSSASTILGMIGVRGKTVVDVGCGQFGWLCAALDLGADKATGVDGHEDSPPESYSGKIKYLRADLSSRLDLGERFDVAVCVEVAEHLPPESSGVIVDTLTRCADFVVFSAAVPGQGGCYHINEQPPAYWADLFASRGYVCADIRARIWDDESIDPWYRQNLLLFAKNDAIGGFSAHVTAGPLHLVHPEIFRIYAPRGEHVIFSKKDGVWSADRVPANEEAHD